MTELVHDLEPGGRRCVAVTDVSGTQHQAGGRVEATESRDQPHIRMSPSIQAATDELRSFMFERVYRDGWRASEEEKCDRLLTHLFEYYTANVGQLPLEYIEIAYLEGAERAVADFISGMTDRYAIRLYREIFMPSSYPSALE